MWRLRRYRPMPRPTTTRHSRPPTTPAAMEGILELQHRRGSRNRKESLGQAEVSRSEPQRVPGAVLTGTPRLFPAASVQGSRERLCRAEGAGERSPGQRGKGGNKQSGLSLRLSPRVAAARSRPQPRIPAPSGRSRQRAAGPPRPPTFLSLHGEAESEAPQQQHQDSGAAGPGGSEGAAAAHAAGAPLPRRSAGGRTGRDGTGRAHGRFRGAAPASLSSRGSDQLLSGALPCAAPSSMLEGGRRGLRAHVRAPLRAGCCLPPPPPPPPPTSAPPAAGGGCARAGGAAGAGCGTGRAGRALHSAAERRGSLWGRQGGGGWGGSKEEREEKPAAPSPPRWRRGGPPPVPEYRMRGGGTADEAVSLESGRKHCLVTQNHITC
ncbi:uncharacterized protein LOC130248810 [Oenanthe melanoleuca]|uniref:uncharacterized protein LOC130248810 n=1 Tax=Oenanthe melanoleuca TaxID=2939378 RepID=UPI0024C12CBB|nr:uncharacterized protein LOC130248810 [Oenanthe melanoleuca]